MGLDIVSRYWCVSTRGNEITEAMIQVWKENFFFHALDNGCISGGLFGDEDTIIAVSVWPDIETMNAVLDSDAYEQLSLPIIASWGTGGINIPDDVYLVVNSLLQEEFIPDLRNMKALLTMSDPDLQSRRILPNFEVYIEDDPNWQNRNDWV